MRRRYRYHGRKRALTPATLLMWIIVGGFLAVFFATRFTLDYTGSYIVAVLERLAG
jgi:hypothetical protein